MWDTGMGRRQPFQVRDSLHHLVVPCHGLGPKTAGAQPFVIAIGDCCVSTFLSSTEPSLSCATLEWPWLSGCPVDDVITLM